MSDDRGSDLDKRLEQVKTDIKALGTSLSGLTNESLLDLNDAAKSIFNEDWFSDMWGDDWKSTLKETWNSRWRDEFNENYRGSLKEKILTWHEAYHNDDKWKFPLFYGQSDEGKRDCGREFGHGPWAGWNNRFRDSYKYKLLSSYGLVSNGAPSVRKYNDCLDKNGQQLYDVNGYWRCLFPNSEISNKVLQYKRENYPNEVLTKEDFIDEVKARNVDLDSSKYDLGEKGIFFKQFEDLMNWKSIMYKNVRDERRQWRHDRRKLRDERLQDNHDQGVVGTAVGTASPIAPETTSSPEKKVISTSVERTYSFNDGNTDFKEVKVEYYDDGTSSVNTTTQLNPERVDADIGPNDQSKGWFWK